MMYPKDAYYLNSDLINKKEKGLEIIDDNFQEMIELVKDKDVFEVGFDFGQRLYALKVAGINVIGGVEFDPTFCLYKKHVGLYDHGWDIRTTQLDLWEPINRKCVITNHFLDLFNEEDRLILLEKLKSTSEELYLNEDCELDLPKEGNIYVFTNVRGDDFKGDSKGNDKKQVELPGFKSLKDRLDATMGNEKDAGENQTGQSDTPSSI